MCEQVADVTRLKDLVIMRLYYWNLNNNSESVRLLKENFGLFSNALFAFSEFWDISNTVKTLEDQYTLSHDVINKRTGLFCGQDSSFGQEGAYRYYSVYSFIYNDMRIVLFVVHLKSQLRSELDARSCSRAVNTEIHGLIKQYNCPHVIIIGDFNLPHFEQIFLDFYSFNATNYYSSDYSDYKTFAGERRLKYYSPISALQGDMSNGPPGTYYYDIASQSQAWHTYDQALISYPLAKYVKKRECCVLTEIGDTKLVTKHLRPDKKFSDHLPIKIEFV